MRSTGFLLLSLASCLRAQVAGIQDFNPLSANKAGIHLYSVNVYSGDYLGGSAGTSISGTAGSPYVTGLVYGASAAFGWTHSSDRSSFSASYSPSFFGSASNSSANSLYHQFSLSEGVKTGKWGFNISLGGAYGDFQQLLFNPTIASYTVSAPSTFDDLAAAMVAGKYTNTQLAAVLTGTLPPISPEQSYLYGQRILAGAISTGVSWQPTTRTSFQVSVSGTRAQNESDNSSSVNSSQNPIPATTSAAASLGWSYSLSPRTQISVVATSSRLLTGMERGYVTSSYFSLARTMSRSWFVQLRGGSGMLDYAQTTPATSHGLQYVAGVSVGYKIQSHTFTASYNRSAGDQYGTGAAATKSATAAWRWRVPNSQWTVSAAFDYQQLVQSEVQNSAGWRANASIARSLGSHMFVSAQYGFYRIPANFAIAGESLSQSAVVLGLSWSPSVYR